MALEREDMEWMDRKFSEVHEKIGKQNTSVVERLTRVETAITAHKHPCDEVTDLKKKVEKNSKGIVTIMLLLASGGAGAAIWYEKILQFLGG
jgi:hypothetical protein